MSRAVTSKEGLLKKIEGYVFDLSGVLLRGERPIPGAPEALKELKRRGKKLAFFTNDNMRTPAYWSERLKGIGIPAEVNEVVNSAVVAAEFIRRRFPGSRVLAVGVGGLLSALEERGIQIVSHDRAKEAEVVVMGRDPDFNYQKLKVACDAIWAGAKFVATNLDATLPVEGGLTPATGPMVKAVAWATGKRPLVMGKPSPYAARVTLTLMGVPTDKGAIVGDQVDIDIRMGKLAGISTILVLSGVTRKEDLRRVPERRRPDLIIPDVTHLVS